MSDHLDCFLAPKGIVVVGASSDSSKLGYSLARNLVQTDFIGAVHFVNPRGGSLLGKQIYTHVALVPDPVDLAVLLIPAPAVPAALEDCQNRGIQAVIISSGGFRETGPEGAALEDRCLQIARRSGMRLMGPNCVGLIDTTQRLNATFLQPPGPKPGGIAFLSHSGAICAAIIDWSFGQGFGMSRLISLGNEADVNETDLLQSVAADPMTRVITLYLEGLSDGRRFIAEAAQAARRKPLVALKVGRFASGRRAVASHTGALAGQEHAFNAAFKRAGVIRANTAEEMFDWARALAWLRPLAGRQIGVLTSAGGPGVTAADALEANGLRLADLDSATQGALQAALPPAASVRNPVDMLASAGPEQFSGCLQLLLADPAVDGVMVILPPPPASSAGAIAKAMIPVIQNQTKPVVVALMGDRLIQEAVEHLQTAHIPEYRFPERAAAALAALAQRHEFLSRADEEPELDPRVNRVLAGQILQTANEMVSRQDTSRGEQSSRMLAPDQVVRLLQAYAIPCAPLELAASANQAVLAARTQGLGQPGRRFVLKIASPDLVHKSDIGGVLLNLDSEESIRAGFDLLLERARQAMPEAEPERKPQSLPPNLLGVYVQPMAPSGQEVILGMVRDPQFGPMVMFGSGGIEVEGLKDLAFGLAPLTRREAQEMLAQTWAGNKLNGFRSIPPADRESVITALLHLAQLAHDFPQIAEIEINPLRVLPAGQGALAIDGRARLG